MSIGFFQEVDSEKKKRKEKDGSLRGSVSRECSYRMGRKTVACL